MYRIFKVAPCDKSAPLRDPETGYCTPATNGEVGLIMNSVNNSSVETRFEGYSDVDASKKKLLHNVLKAGDCYFNSGDLLSRNNEGFYFW
jgi:fatty-acyl-CoA synthase